MKKILYSLFLVLPAFFISCDEDEHGTLTTIYNDSEAIPATGGTTTFKIDTDSAWEIFFGNSDIDEEFIDISPLSGKGSATVTVKVTEVNPTTELNGVTFLVVANGDVQPVTIMQAAAELTYSISPASIALPATANVPVTTAVMTNSGHFYAYRSNIVTDDWYDIDYRYDSDSGVWIIEIKAPTTTPSVRSGKIIIELWDGEDYVEKEVTVTQAASVS